MGLARVEQQRKCRTPKTPPPNTVEGLGLGPCPVAVTGPGPPAVVVGTPPPPADVPNTALAPVPLGVVGLVVKNERGVEPPEVDGPPIAPKPPPNILVPTLKVRGRLG